MKGGGGEIRLADVIRTPQASDLVNCAFWLEDEECAFGFGFGFGLLLL